LLGLTTVGLLVIVVVACVAGIAFATLAGVLVAVMLMVATWLPPEIAGVPAMAALWSFGIGLTLWISWVISERVFDSSSGEALRIRHRSHRVLHLFVLAGGAFSCYLSGENGLQRIALAGLLSLGIALHPLIDLIKRKVQRRHRPLAFLSYRRHDDASRDLVEKVHRRLPPGSAFWDKRMPSGEWQPSILRALERATVLLTFVGPHWKAEEKKEEEEERKEKEEVRTVQRRPSFWVWLELGYASRRKIPILPIMIDHDDCPQHLLDIQYASVSSESEQDLDRLIDTLKSEQGIRLQE